MALRNTPPSPQPPSGIPDEQYEAEVAVQLQRSVGLGWVGVAGDPVDNFIIFDKRDNSHLADALRAEERICLILRGFLAALCRFVGYSLSYC